MGLPPGSDFVQQMHQTVQKAKRTIAVHSPAYLDSAVGGAEWPTGFAKDPTGERGLLVPDRVEEVQPPDLLTTRIYVDLVGKNTADARAALLAAARDARGKPVEEPEFPGYQRAWTTVPLCNMETFLALAAHARSSLWSGIRSGSTASLQCSTGPAGDS